MTEFSPNKFGAGVMSAGQARVKGEDRWYAPARDITTLLPAALHYVFDHYEELELGIPEAEVCKIAEAIAGFMSRDTVLDSVSFEDAMTGNRMYEIEDGAMGRLMAGVGRLMLGAFWYGIRDATMAKATQITQYDERALIAAAANLVKRMRDKSK